ncbi:MAG: glutamine--fructose-6-phosphate transaminase (isomerizing) [Clostridiales bacterium]|nr:glutamine--fructose-6-phosphate transaminase (isomerizing) [Clostridiales bacterium]
MCGVYGYIGNNAIEKTLKGISRLEYRGYDSAGIAFLNKNKNLQIRDEKLNKNIKIYDKNIVCIKQTGEIKELMKVMAGVEAESEIAVCHTRWVTHGKVSIENSHPHISKNGKWTLVHNGIIQNYIDLKSSFNDSDFVSQTDTEVVVHLLEKMDNGNPLETLRNVCELLEGSYALAVICSDWPNEIFVAKKESPVVVGCGEGFGVVCSDLNSIEECEKIFILDEENLAVVGRNCVEIYDYKLNKQVKKSINIERENDSFEVENHPHYMCKEINETPKVLLKTIEKYEKIDDFLCVFDKIDLKSIDKLLIIGCGTAYHAGKIGGEIIEKECKIKTETMLASEFISKEFLYDQKTLAVFISQSGETADTLKAISRCKENGISTLAITNVKNSTITRVCDYVIYTYAGKEIAVASTKAFNCQVALIYLFSAFLKSVKEGKDYLREEGEQLKKVAEKIRQTNNDLWCKKIAEKIKNEKSIYMIGRGLDYLLAKESALKLKEISYIHCEAMPAGELKHGTISLIENGSKVFAFCSVDEVAGLMEANIKEVQSRGADVVAISRFGVSCGAECVKVDNLLEKYFPVYAVVYMQKIAYYTSLALGINPDKPRSLAKSVTVE